MRDLVIAWISSGMSWESKLSLFQHLCHATSSFQDLTTNRDGSIAINSYLLVNHPTASANARSISDWGKPNSVTALLAL